MKKEKRILTLKTEVRALIDDTGNKIIEGLIPYNSLSEDMGFFEIITPSAFTRTLNNGTDVKALYNHDDSKVLGRVANGSLILTSTDKGLNCVCSLPNTSYANDVYELINKNYVPTMSFGFRIIQENIRIENTKEIHDLLEVKLVEVSYGVTFPAYPETKANTRNIRSINLDELETTISKETLEDKDYISIGNVIKQLSDLIPVKAPEPIPETSPAISTEEPDIVSQLIEALKS